MTDHKTVREHLEHARKLGLRVNSSPVAPRRSPHAGSPDYLSRFARHYWYRAWLFRLRCIAAVRAARRSMEAR